MQKLVYWVCPTTKLKIKSNCPENHFPDNCPENHFPDNCFHFDTWNSWFRFVDFILILEIIFFKKKKNPTFPLKIHNFFARNLLVRNFVVRTFPVRIFPSEFQKKKIEPKVFRNIVIYLATLAKNGVTQITKNPIFFRWFFLIFKSIPAIISGFPLYVRVPNSNPKANTYSILGNFGQKWRYANHQTSNNFSMIFSDCQIDPSHNLGFPLIIYWGPKL